MIAIFSRTLVLAGGIAALPFFFVRASAAEQSVAAMRLDADLARDLGDRCRYVLAVHGTTTPIPGSRAVEPKIDVHAVLRCPGGGAVNIDDAAMATGPLTKEQLVRALERRGTLVTSRPGRCVYVPELALTGADLELRSVSVACR